MRKNLLSPVDNAFLTETFARNRARFGGWSMEEPSEAEAAAAAAEKATADKAAEDAKNKFEPITSQEDLDRRLGERLAREKAKYADYDDLKKAKVEHDKLIAANQTEHEKALAAAREEGKTEVQTAANTRLISAEARALAAEAKFRNPALAVKAVDLKDVKVGDDGTVDGDAIKAKLKELSDADPYLLDDGKKPAPKPDKAQGGTVTKTDKSVASGREMFDSRRAKKTPAST